MDTETKDTCEWTRDDNWTWHTQCGEEWSFSGHYSPRDNGMTFCFNCGRKMLRE